MGPPASPRRLADDEPGPGARGLLDSLSALLDDVREIARERAASVAEAARREADRLEARLRRMALTAGACIGAGVLLVVGVSGALGEVAGRTWVGQLAAGVIVLLAVVGWAAWTSWRGRRQAARSESTGADRARSLAEAGRSLPLLGMAGAAGWVAGMFLGHRRGRHR